MDESENARPATIARLRKRLAALEGVTDKGHTRGLNFGLHEIDTHLNGGLHAGCIHEFQGPAALGLVVFLAGHAQGEEAENDILWCAQKNSLHGLYPPGLISHALDPHRIIHVQTHTRDDLYWALEEGLRAKAVGAVILETAHPMSLTVARRIKLAAEAGETPALIVGQNEKAICPSASTRWQINHLPPATERANENGFDLKLTRNKSGALKEWQVRWDETAHCLRLAAAASDRPHHTHRHKVA